MVAPMTYWVRDNPITSAQNDVNSVKTTFSSWDNCMQKDYCKYPVIILIVIASLIVLSIITCLVRCLCCGLECCCGCFSCLNACCSCCQPRRRRWGNDGYDDGPRGGGGGWNQPGPYSGYQPPPAQPVYVNVQTGPNDRYEPNRQYASYDAPSKRGMGPYSGGNEDSLPAMPSWSDARSKRIETEEEEVEMDHLYATQAQRAPMMTPGSSGVGTTRGPTPGAQTPGGGLYHDEPAHESGDLADGYADPHHDEEAYGHGAGVAAAAGAVGGAAMAHHYGQESGVAGYQSPPPQQHGGYGAPPPGAMGGMGYGGAPNQQQQYQQQQHQDYRSHAVSPPPPSNFTSPPPSYRTGGPVSPVSTPGPVGLPSSLTPGARESTGFQPPAAQQQYHSYGGQQSGVTGSNQPYNAYQSHGNPPHGSWQDV